MDIDPSFADYLRIVKKRKWVIGAVTVIATLAGMIYTKSRIPLYRTSSLVRFEPPGGRSIGIDLMNWDQYAAMQTQARIISSAEIAQLAAKKMGNPQEKHPGSYSAARIPDSNLITITATGRMPEEITRLANAVAEAYAERDYEERSRTARKTVDEIMARRQDVETTLREFEEAKQVYLEDHHLSGLGSALSGTLMEHENRRKELLKKFTEEHPDVAMVNQKIQQTKARLAEIPGQEVDLERLSRDIRINEDLYMTLARQLEEAKIVLSAVPVFVTVVSRAKTPAAPFYPSKGSNYLMGILSGLFLGLLTAFFLENLDISISTIEELEKFLGVPVLAVIPHLGTKSRWEELKAELLRKKRYPMDIFRSLLIFQQTAKAPTIEVYHSLRRNIQSALPGKRGLVLTFTSSGVAEGKTLTAINFCMAAAYSGLKTLLVGADTRRPVVYKIFGLPRAPGLLEVLAGKARSEDVVRGTVDFLMGELDLDRLLAFPGIDNFKVMTGWMPNATDIVNLFSSPALHHMVEDLRQQYDLVVFDCPPVLLFVDPVLIGPHTDAMVLVYKSGMMARQALRRAKDQVVASNVKIAGVVLNDMLSTDMEPRYGYYYDYGHYATREEN